MIGFTPEEQLMILLYSPGNLSGLIAQLTEMKEHLTPAEKKLKTLTETTLSKLSQLNEDAFNQLDFFLDEKIGGCK